MNRRFRRAATLSVATAFALLGTALSSATASQQQPSAAQAADDKKRVPMSNAPRLRSADKPSSVRAAESIMPKVSVQKKDGTFLSVPAPSVGEARRLAAQLQRAGDVKQASVSKRRYSMAEDWQPRQYYLDEIAVADYWNAGHEGTGIKVAVVDSGIDWKNHVDFTRTDGTYQVKYSVNYTDLAHTDDRGWHGTHVAGILAAARNTAGIVGVAPEIQLMDVRVLDANGEGSSGDVARGISWAVRHGARIIVLALGGDADPVEQAAVEAAESAGVLVVAAGGNDFLRGNEPSYPAAYPEAFAVAAVDDDNYHASFSTTGDYIDISAPGVGILSDIPGDAANPDGLVGEADGTSMAAPIVAGMAANLLSSDPTLTLAQLKQKLLDSAQDIGEIGHDKVYGAGVVRPALGAAPGTVTLSGPSVSDAGSNVSYTAHVEDAGTPKAGITVDLVAREAGRYSWLPLTSAVTDANGDAVLTTPLKWTMDVAAITRHDGSNFSVSTATSMRTLAKIVVTNNTPVVSGDRVLLSGTVRPEYIGTYRTIRLQKWYSGPHAWMDIGTIRPDSQGRWKAAVWSGSRGANLRIFINSHTKWLGGPGDFFRVNMR